jgi:hypothetical protein
LNTAVASLLLCALLARDNAVRTLSSYLFSWLFFLGLSLGSMGALMMHQLTGGRWGSPVHRYFMAALAPLPLQALLFVPVALGMAHLFPWVAHCCGGGETSQFRQIYLSRSTFLVRSGIALSAWWMLARLLRTKIAERRCSPAFCAAGLLIYLVTMSWTAVDWIASLEPRWSSSVLGLLMVMGQILAAFAFATLCATRSSRNAIAPSAADCGDLGNLLFTFVMTWMYLAFVQFLIIWEEDLPRETIWYLPRLHGRWGILSLLVATGQFGVPFALLLFRRLKRDVKWLRRIAMLLLLSAWLYATWLILPTTQPTGPMLSVSDLAATAGIGGLWCFAFFRGLDATAHGPAEAEPESEPSYAPRQEQTHGS